MDKGARDAVWHVVRTLCLVLLWALPAGQVQAETAPAESLTLAEAVQRALASSTRLELARFSVEEAEIALEEALIGRLAGQPETEVQAARSVLDDARQGYIDQLVSLALEVEEAYYAVIRSSELLQIQQGNMEQADRQFAVARARYEAGLISRQELLQAELAHEQSVTALERAERQLAEARRILARLIGAGEDAVFVLEDTFPFEPFAIALEDAIREALENRSEIKQAERNLAQARVRVAQADNPYTAPVVLRQAQMAARRAEIQLEQTRVQVIDAVRQSWWALKDAEANVEAARKREAIAADALAISQVRFDAGMISLIDLLRDQAAALQARLDATAAVWDYNLAKARFLRALGRAELPPLPDAIAAYIAGWNAKDASTGV